MSFGGGGVKIDDTLSKQSAALTREQYNDFLRRFRPVENYALKQVDNNEALGERVRTNIATAGEAFDRGVGQTGREMARYGIQITPDKRRAMERVNAHNKTLTLASAGNNTRDAAETRDVNMYTNLVNMGRGISADAGAMLGSATGMEASRNATNQQLKAQENANEMQGLGTVAGIASNMAAAYFFS